MEINLNKVANTETSEFINFSIREYVAKIRSKDPKKCWPFGSLCDPNENEVFTSYESTESPRFLSTQTRPSNVNGSIDKPEHIVAPNSRKGELNNGKKDMVESFGNDDYLSKVVYNECLESTSSNENIAKGIAKNTQSVAVENDELETNRLKRKPQKFRLLSDLLKDPASKVIRAHCGITNPENVNKRFFMETEDGLDDNVTLDGLFRKRKGVQVTGLTLKKKKKTIRVEKLSVDHDIKSKHGSKDSAEKVLQVAPRIRSRKRVRNYDDIDKQAMVKGKKDCGLPLSQKMNRYTEVSYEKVTKTANEDSEMEAVMLLARHFNDENPLTNERILSELKTNTSCACAQKKIKKSPNESAPKLIMTKSSKIVSKNFQAGDHLKGTTACVFQGHVEICYTKAAAAVMRETVCSVNKNPADFSSPNAENMFMRGG